MEKNQELEGEILSKGIEQGKDLLFEETNTKTLAAELEEISNKKVKIYLNIQDDPKLGHFLSSSLRPSTETN